MIKCRNQRLITSFGKNIRRLRRKKGLSMRALARLAGIQYSQISIVETGKANTTISTAAVLAEALNVPLNKLFVFKSGKSKK